MISQVASLVFVSIICFQLVNGHTTPCNQNNDTKCLAGVQEAFIANSNWFGITYNTTCPNGNSDKSFLCYNPDLVYKNIASRFLRKSDFNTSLIDQFLRVRYNTSAGSYVSCGHRYTVDAYTSTSDQDNTHTIYLDMWLLNHKPSITFTPKAGVQYTLVAYDPGYLRLSGLWVNINTNDISSGKELFPHSGPLNPIYEKSNMLLYALFTQQGGVISDIENQKSNIRQSIRDNDGLYYFDAFIDKNSLEGPVGVGYVTVHTDPFGIQFYLDRNMYNNCPYLVSSIKVMQTALIAMGYQLTDANSYTDYRGTFLTGLEMEIQVTYLSPDVEFDSCCKHFTESALEVTVDPIDTAPILPLYTRSPPFVRLAQMEMRQIYFTQGKIYTLLLLDATEAALNMTSPNTILHWQIVNIPGNDVTKGDTVLPYLPPLPRNSSSVRTFMFLLLRQSVSIDPQTVWSYSGTGCDQWAARRCKFDLGTFIQYLNLKVAGLTTFLSQQDHYSRAVLYGGTSSVSSSMGLYSSTGSPLMTMAQACSGVAGYASPCPGACSISNPAVTSPVTTTTTTTTTTSTMNHMGM